MSGRSEASFGRKRRSLNDTETTDEVDDSSTIENEVNLEKKKNETDSDTDADSSIDFPEHVREMIEVFESRDEIDSETKPRKLVSSSEMLCITPSEYNGMVAAIMLLMLLLVSITLAAGLAYR